MELWESRDFPDVFEAFLLPVRFQETYNTETFKVRLACLEENIFGKKEGFIIKGIDLVLLK
jgi:hypothetical protein